MDQLSLLPRPPGGAGRPRGGEAGSIPRDDSHSPRDRSGRNRYRVDQAYQSYTEELKQNAANAHFLGLGAVKKQSSAELLATMIHQMGGGIVSSAKGVFVDISI